MKRKILPYVAALIASLFFATTALAGPPLLCHTFDIGDAKSLPWTGPGWNLSPADSSYDTKNLSTDTLTILNADSTALVHMETLRRAALFAQNDSPAAKQLLLKLIARADASSTSTSEGAMARFDEGYFAATLDQLHWIKKDFANPAQNLDAYGLIRKSLEVRPTDGQLNFAAALVILEGPVLEQREHAQKAISGAQSDPLLARNLATHFMGAQTETMSQMINRNTTMKVARQ